MVGVAEGRDPRTAENDPGAADAPPASTRRGFLSLAAGGVAAVAVGTAVGGDVYAVRRGVFAAGSGPAYAPWVEWDRGALPLRLVRAGILAANAHNAQAWRFAVTPHRIDVHDDTGRSLGAVDAYRREIHLSAGCAIENITLAARAAGLLPTVTLRPTGDPGPLARPAALAVLVAGAVAPAITGWWSLVIPVTGLLALLCGSLAIRATTPVPGP